VKYIFLNPHSCGGLGSKKWQKIAGRFDDAVLVPEASRFHWQELTFSEADSFFSAGGDGTLHSMVNALVQNRSLEILKNIKIGHIGIGSNNSFLRPFTNCTSVHGIPMAVSDQTFLQDLMEIKVGNGRQKKSYYCVSNASLGFLANANEIFNTSASVSVLKKYSADVADVLTFFKSILKWRSLDLSIETNHGKKNVGVTNIHFMKKPFYAADLGFNEMIAPNSGTFRMNLLKSMGRGELCRRFFKVFAFKDFNQGRHETAEYSWMRIVSRHEIPMEMDGEIYWGTEFEIRCLQGAARVCR
jgi:diacylglycerol kinase family enzyme